MAIVPIDLYCSISMDTARLEYIDILEPIFDFPRRCSKMILPLSLSASGFLFPIKGFGYYIEYLATK